MSRIADDTPVGVDEPGRFRPGVLVPAQTDWSSLLGVAAMLAILVALMLGPLWSDPATRLLGDPDTDAIRGMWGFDHVRRSMLPPDTPIWSGQVNFPHGVLALILPFATALLTTPLTALFGPVVGYNLSIAVMLWAAGLAVAALARQASDSWPAGLVAGAAFLSQPMLIFAVADGTPEHVAVWGIPVFLLVAGHAIQVRTAAWGAAAGMMAIVVAMDGPYNAIFAMQLGVVVLPVALVAATRRDRGAAGMLPAVAAFLLVAAVGGAILALLYSNFTLEGAAGADKARLLKMNAADLHSWWQFDFGPKAERDPSLAPTLIPTVVLAAAVLLALGGIKRSAAWLFAGILALTLSFGWNAYLPQELAQWLRGFGRWLGNWMLTINVWAYELPGLDSIRFPRRFLVPAALALLVAGSVGLGRIFGTLKRRGPIAQRSTWGIAALLAAGAVFAGGRSGRLQHNLPMQNLPPVQFAEWINAQPGGGGVLTLPQVRAAPRSGRRADLPVFAGISDSLSSADTQYLQVLHGQPIIGYPSLKTLVPMAINADVAKLTRNWDDLAHPMTSGNPIPRSAYDERNEPSRQANIEWLRRQGLRYIVVDMGVYNDQGFGILKGQLDAHTKELRQFDDGDGVSVFELLQ